jgi:E3 ubiquitin-protein ligase RFWD2
VQEIVSRKKRKLMSHFSDLQARYFDSKSEARNIAAVRTAGSNVAATDQGVSQPAVAVPQDESESALENFSHSISSLTKFSRLRHCAALKYDSVHGTSNIVSSIEFDRDNEFFACAGVTKKIKIFELKSILDGSGSVHFPVHEITCRAKLRYSPQQQRKHRN